MEEIETTGNSILQGNLYWLTSKTGMLGKLFGITIYKEGNLSRYRTHWEAIPSLRFKNQEEARIAVSPGQSLRSGEWRIGRRCRRI